MEAAPWTGHRGGAFCAQQSRHHPPVGLWHLLHRHPVSFARSPGVPAHSRAGARAKLLLPAVVKIRRCGKPNLWRNRSMFGRLETNPGSGISCVAAGGSTSMVESRWWGRSGILQGLRGFACDGIDQGESFPANSSPN
jgi:hypothetical protein